MTLSYCYTPLFLNYLFLFFLSFSLHRVPDRRSWASTSSLWSKEEQQMWSVQPHRIVRIMTKIQIQSGCKRRSVHTVHLCPRRTAAWLQVTSCWVWMDAVSLACRKRGKPQRFLKIADFFFFLLAAFKLLSKCFTGQKLYNRTPINEKDCKLHNCRIDGVVLKWRHLASRSAPSGRVARDYF